MNQNQFNVVPFHHPKEILYFATQPTLLTHILETIDQTHLNVRAEIIKQGDRDPLTGLVYSQNNDFIPEGCRIKHEYQIVQYTDFPKTNRILATFEFKTINNKYVNGSFNIQEVEEEEPSEGIETEDNGMGSFIARKRTGDIPKVLTRTEIIKIYDDISPLKVKNQGMFRVLRAAFESLTDSHKVEVFKNENGARYVISENDQEVINILIS